MFISINHITILLLLSLIWSIHSRNLKQQPEQPSNLSAEFQHPWRKDSWRMPESTMAEVYTKHGEPGEKVVVV